MDDRVRKNSKNGSKKSGVARKRQRQIQILSILLIITGVLVLLSIVSYSSLDALYLSRLSVLDIFRLPFDSGVRSVVANLENRLGLIGAMVAGFFVESTIGYASIVAPVLMILWGWIFLRKKPAGMFLTFTNYALLFALLLATAFGIANIIAGSIDTAWSGLTSAFIADVLANLLGSIGSAIVVLTLLALTTILAIDLDIHRSLERGSDLWNALRQRFFNRGDERRHSRVVVPDPDEEPEETPVREVVIRKPHEEEHRPVHRPAPPVVVAGRAEEDDLSPEADDSPETPASAGGGENLPEEIDYVFPSVDLLDPAVQTDTVKDEELKANAELVRSKLANFDVEIESVSVTPGPVITLYELVPASGVKISRIVNLADDLALALAAKGIRIIAPIPGKSAVGVEIPNRNPSMVHLRTVLNSTKFREFKAALPLALGKTISGDVYIDDLGKMPHLLIAGSTGSGKSVGINTFLASLLFRLHPSDVKFVIIDPKKIELTLYARLRHHFLAVSPDINEDIITTPENAVGILKSVELEMEQRYEKLAAAGVRNILDYNDRFKAGRLKDSEKVRHGKIPYLVVVIDELADLMITAAREVEEPIARLAQLARAVGIHLVLATQRPSVDVITGVIKANFPARIAYQVASKTDSRTILDMNGAEQLLGSGDMLYLPSGSPKPLRIQNAFISTDEVERLTEHIERQQGYSKPFQLPSVLARKSSRLGSSSSDRDEFFEEAARLIVRHQQGSVSLIQRRLKVGYSRAARIVDELEAAGIVGPFDGSKARLVLIEDETQLDRLLEAQQ
jgi:S-DNA-T family DNA segregation ATPase FtsK/SpoIIIE